MQIICKDILYEPEAKNTGGVVRFMKLNLHRQV